jgi:hypothetical protein
MTMQRIQIMGVILAASALAQGGCRRSTNSEAAATQSAPSCVETNARPGIAAACMACLKKYAIQSPDKDGCCGIADPMGRQLCDAVGACLRAGGPPVGSCNLAGDTTTCYCGKNQAGCDIDGKANGPCLALVSAAAGRNIETGTTDKPGAAEILARYGDIKYAIGRATNVAAIAGAYCKIECETGM